MLNSPIRMLDPELVVPSPAAAKQLEFWQRMTLWALDREPRLGPSTLEGLSSLASNPPKVDGLPLGDFWTILGKYMSRGFTPSAKGREICDVHIRGRYSPVLGSQDNLERLIADLIAAGPTGRVAVTTIRPCWPATENQGCECCANSRISHLFGKPETETAVRESALLWREAFCDDHSQDLSILAAYAPKMFPDIEFAQDAWKRLNTLEGAAEDNKASLVQHLGVLNDFGPEIWTNEVTTEGRQAALGAKGIIASPEGPRIHRWTKAMNERTFLFGYESIICEWHTKIRPDSNRVYFAINGDKVMVGVIVNHLLV